MQKLPLHYIHIQTGYREGCSGYLFLCQGRKCIYISRSWRAGRYTILTSSDWAGSSQVASLECIECIAQIIHFVDFGSEVFKFFQQRLENNRQNVTGSSVNK